MDSRVPYILTKEQRASLNDDPTIIKMRQTKKDWLEKIQHAQRTLKNARRTVLYAQHKSAKLDLKADRKAQTRVMEIRLRDEYFENIHMQSLSQQREGTRCNLAPKTHEEASISRSFVFLERARIADAFFPSRPISETNALTCRLSIISDLITPCAKRELPQRRSASPRK